MCLKFKLNLKNKYVGNTNRNEVPKYVWNKILEKVLNEIIGFYIGTLII